MRGSTEKSFTPSERRAALLAVLAAAAIAGGGFLMDQAWGSPPLGAYADAGVLSPIPGVLEARPAG